LLARRGSACIWSRLEVLLHLSELLKDHSFEFAVERAVFVATLHRLFVSGSDRDCSVWMEDYDIHFYRAMAWLGVSLCYLAELSIVDLGVGGSYAGAAIGDWRTGFFWTIS
jgi:hypothetical protein